MLNKDIKILREQLILENNNICALCNEELVRPCLDHSHSSGKIRNVICSNCNVLIGKWENGVIRTGNKNKLETITKNLWTYLQSEREEIHPSFGKKKKKK